MYRDIFTVHRTGREYNKLVGAVFRVADGHELSIHRFRKNMKCWHGNVLIIIM